jgi:hypothetical protein
MDFAKFRAFRKLGELTNRLAKVKREPAISAKFPFLF